MASGSQVSSLVFGGVFIGIWLYIALFGVPSDLDNDGSWSDSAWALWGFVGLILAGALYGTRITRGWMRVSLFVLIGTAIAMLAMAFFFDEVVEGLASLVTLVGGGLIVSVLPVALQQSGDQARTA